MRHLCDGVSHIILFSQQVDQTKDTHHPYASYAALDALVLHQSL